jgi:CRP-like cAMP-binding protein
MTVLSFVKDSGGATALEFGLTAPVFFMMLIGVVEVGLLFWTQVRKKGEHYRDMYVLTDGCVEVDPGAHGAAAKLVASGAGCPIGEIGFLHGRPARATAIAGTAVGALVIDGPTFARLEREQPVLAAQLLRRLAAIAEGRTSQDRGRRAGTARRIG